MNKKVTLNSLAERVASQSGLSIQEAENRIKSYFDLLATALIEDGNIKVKGLGTFKAIGIEARESIDVSTGNRVLIPGHKRATFTPEKSLADKVNAPFAAFEAVELSDDITEKELENLDVEESISEPNIDDLNTEETIVEDVKSNNPELISSEGIIEKSAEEENIVEATEDSFINQMDYNEPDNVELNPIVENESEETVPEDDEEISFDESSKFHRKGFYRGFFLGIGCMLLIFAGFWCWYIFAPESFDNLLSRPVQTANTPVIISEVAPTGSGTNKSERENSNEAIMAPVEEVEINAEVPTEESDKNINPTPPVYDTISKTRFLTTMAREHYGSYHLWPYIYMENSNILGHPDRIKPGTRVVIPPKEKYDIDANNKECISKAKKLGAEIYAKYK